MYICTEWQTFCWSALRMATPKVNVRNLKANVLLVSYYPGRAKSSRISTKREKTRETRCYWNHFGLTFGDGVEYL